MKKKKKLKNESNKEVKQKIERVPYETYSKERLLKENNVSIEQGLNEAEVQERKNKFGLNKLAEKKKKSIIQIFFAQLNDPMIYILIFAAILSFVLSFVDTSGEQIKWSTEHIDYIEPLVIMAVILINGIIGTVQEAKAEKSLEALKKMSAPTSVVRRDGKIITIPAEELVPGDIVILEEGTSVPADIRLLSSVNLKTDESSLTGESLPIEKDSNLVLTEEVGLGDRSNMVFMSTPIVYGHGEGIVVETGMHTEIGNIASMLQDEGDETTPLQKKLASLSKLLGIITIVLVVIFFGIAILQSVLQGKPLLDTIITMFVTSISLAVAAVPEGLPAVVTIVLALGVQRMVKVNTIVKKLPSVETLGAVTVVCSDKTGTLTQNKMTVVRAYLFDRFILKDDLLNATDDVKDLATGLSLCSNASIHEGKAYGDPTEVALVEFSNLYQNTKEIIEAEHPRLNELPFDSVRKMMTTSHQYDDRVINFTKGAVDQILKHTISINDNGVIRDITSKDKEMIMNASAKMSDDALRVLALAYRVNGELEEENLIFYGLVGMVDPPREEAKPAIEQFKKAGIVTVMITGDHKDTAFAIAKELGIAESRNQCMSGDEIDACSPEELQEKVKTCRVFARVSPENKVSIVKAFKANGNIAAMTGDGVNDAPSLKAADIGIAMGITGTDVAKGAADMVLRDDNFASIEKAVEEGRGIYANIKKTVLFLLSSNIGEVLCMFIAVCMGLPTPLAAIHILFVNLVTDSIPAVALGSDAKDPSIMNDKPRDPKESLFAKGGYLTLFLYGTVIGVITLIAFLYHPIRAAGGFDLPKIIELLNTNEQLLLESETCAFIVLAMSQLFHMLGMSNVDKTFWRTFTSKNWLFLVSFIIGFGLLALMTEVDAVGAIFNTTHMDAIHWVVLTLISAIPLFIHEIIVLIKYYFRNSDPKISKFYKITLVSFVIAAIIAAVILLIVFLI